MIASDCCTTNPMFCFQAEDGIRDADVTGVQTCALPIYLPAENRAVEVRGRFGGLRWYFQITDLAVGHYVSNKKYRGAPPNGSRLSCGALKNDSFPNLRAPAASSAC